MKSLNRIVEAAAQVGGLVAMTGPPPVCPTPSSEIPAWRWGSTRQASPITAPGTAPKGKFRGWTMGPGHAGDSASSALPAGRTEEIPGRRVGTARVIAGISGVWNAVAIQEAWGGETPGRPPAAFTCPRRRRGGADGFPSPAASSSGVNAYSQYPGVGRPPGGVDLPARKTSPSRFPDAGQGPSMWRQPTRRRYRRLGHRGAAGPVGVLPAPAGGRESSGTPCPSSRGNLARGNPSGRGPLRPSWTTWWRRDGTLTIRRKPEIDTSSEEIA